MASGTPGGAVRPRGGGRAVGVVLGTGTGVGKTWVTAHLAAELHQAYDAVLLRKPLQSGEPGETSDAQVLAAASGEPVDEVCPASWSYTVAMAPPMAAQVLDRPCPTLEQVMGWLGAARGGTGTIASTTTMLLVETVGGVRSPCCADGDSAALAAALRPDVAVLVAEPGLGALNAVRLSLQALAAVGSPDLPRLVAPVLVHLNRYDGGEDLHRRNRAWLESDGVETSVSIPALARRIAGAVAWR